ncbi:molybdate ABC transporter permease subunit [Treponema phagedenis]|uniref:Molybdenum transport system permease n=1 Tax=Treponema phagedenis TaxID=162 RepID=A0A0B7GWX6_TREPH|nr:molybdate ABC transporter permease subunit [Treponema phagedenis]NVP24773.1 molybdate ABC transporter permease subunit [Treponema phagedenis]QEJ95883.1 molybdate ABC transporter permease subunit [Treponema phagedenis]QEJ98887.1 molybdate ABC transporter permease subunit [Treponema phagedenis]QEK00419.1 molybdate ABC transporter permease subunit [Treponema phagedenis]QEK04395.1 molybdate ABC transporter permease subunit [Treponema phagedenis]
MSSLQISVKTGIISTFITFFLGIFAANFVMKTKYKALFDGIFTLPLVLPPTVVGFLLLMFFGARGVFAPIYNLLNFQIVFSYWATVIAAVVVSFPLMYRTALGSFLQVDKEYLDAAKTLGMNKRKIFWKILLPLSKDGLLAGIVLSFSRAIGEFGATIMISGNIVGRTQTVSTAIYSAVQAGNKMLALKYSLVIITLSFIFIILLNTFGMKKWR